MELLIGCGNSRTKHIQATWRPKEWTRLVTLDIDPSSKPDVVADLNDGLPFADNTFDEVHAYEVLEHVGQQGDYLAFFKHFGELYRVTKPYGIVCGTTPKWDSRWAWGDPGHTRIITPDTLSYLNQATYAEGVGSTCRTDYRRLWKGDMRLVWLDDTTMEHSHLWILQVIKEVKDAQD